jgi:hypothetical protein
MKRLSGTSPACSLTQTEIGPALQRRIGSAHVLARSSYDKQIDRSDWALLAMLPAICFVLIHPCHVLKNAWQKGILACGPDNLPLRICFGHGELAKLVHTANPFSLVC